MHLNLLLFVKTREGKLFFIFYFFVLLFVALSVRDFSVGYKLFNQLDPYNTTLQQLIEKTFPTDPHRVGLNALALVKSPFRCPEACLFWPPAFMVSEALVYSIVKLLGLPHLFIFILQLLAVSAFAYFMTFFRKVLCKFINVNLATILPLTLMLFPSNRLFLQPGGVILGESFAICFFFIGLLFIVDSIHLKKSRIIAGICLALSAYFRSQFDVFILGLTFFTILFFLLFRFLEKKLKLKKRKEINFLIKNIGIVLIITHSITFPWRVRNLFAYKSLMWVQTDKSAFRDLVSTPEQLDIFFGGHKGDGSFVYDGGGDLACRIDPSVCDNYKDARINSLKTLVKHPIKWYSLKLGILPKYWFETRFTDTVFLVMIAFVMILPFFLIRYNILFYLLMIFNFAIPSAYFLIFTIQQFEVRYFYFIKIYGLIMFILEMSVLYSLKQKKHENRNV